MSNEMDQDHVDADMDNQGMNQAPPLGLDSSLFFVDTEDDSEQQRFLALKLRDQIFIDDETEQNDITAEQVQCGRDIQGITWADTGWTREAYRQKRDADLTSYYNREDEVKAAEESILSNAIKSNERPHPVKRYPFFRSWRSVRATIVHFQLRNLLWPISSHELVYVSDNRVLLWDNMTRSDPLEIFDVSGAEGSHASFGPALDEVNICTLCAKHNLVAAGGFGGELLVRPLNFTYSKSVQLNSLDNNDKRSINDPPLTVGTGLRVTNSENGITNAIEIYKAPGGATHIACSNNDSAVRIFDAGSLSASSPPLSTVNLPWAVNCCVSNPSGSLLCAVGDDPVGVLIDPRTPGAYAAPSNVVATLSGHYDYSFAAAWHPHGHMIATGNQDLTTRIFDVRMIGHGCLYLLRGRYGAIRSLRFSSDGQTLAVAEPTDYVTLYDVFRNYETCQTIDAFGLIGGMGFSPDSERFFTTVVDITFATTLQYNRRREIFDDDREDRGDRGWDRDRIYKQWELDFYDCG